MVPESWDIVQGMQFLQVNLQKFRFEHWIWFNVDIPTQTQHA